MARLLYFFPFFNSTELGLFVVNLFVLWGIINFGLFVFNLIPIPPLDGSHLYLTFMTETNPRLASAIYRIGMFVLLAVILIQNRTSLDILPVNKIVYGICDVLDTILNF
jgi:Zn-dependent protease